MMHALDVIQVSQISRDICVIQAVLYIGVREQNLNFTALGVDAVMSSCSDMFYDRTWFAAYIYLDTVDAAVAQVRNWKVYNAISSEEGE